MSKFKVGDKVRVTGNSYYSGSDFIPERGSCLIGEVCEIKQWFPNSNTASVYTPDKSDWWVVRARDISSVSATPKEITLNGSTYVLKEEQKPEHEWKFGDWARHPNYGVVFVGNVNGSDEIWCVVEDSSGWRYGQHVSPAELTYISSATIPV